MCSMNSGDYFSIGITKDVTSEEKKKNIIFDMKFIIKTNKK